MMTCVDEQTLPLAWGRMVRPMLSLGGPNELGPVCVSFPYSDGNRGNEPGVTLAALDAVLEATGRQRSETVANTIFPQSLWNPALGRDRLFTRYRAIAARIRKSAPTKNKRGLYFERMISGGPSGSENQLDFILSTFSQRAGVRRGLLQLGIYDPTRDLTSSAQLGFPCLQHVTFAPVQGALNVNAFYATQYAVERAFGNYWGLARLGAFVAHELGMPVGRITCLTGIMIRDDINAGQRRSIVSAIDAAFKG